MKRKPCASRAGLRVSRPNALRSKQIALRERDVAGIWRRRVAAAARHRCRSTRPKWPRESARLPGPASMRVLLEELRAPVIGWQRPGHPPVLASAVPDLRPSTETPRPLSLASSRCEELDRVVRVASAAAAGFKPFFSPLSAASSLTQTPGLSGAWGVPTSSSTGARSLETAPANPRQAQTTKVCADALGVSSAVRPLFSAVRRGSPGEPFLAQRCAGLDVLRSSAPR